MQWTAVEWIGVWCAALALLTVTQLLVWAWRNRGGEDDLALMREAAQGDAMARDALRERVQGRMVADAGSQRRLRALLGALTLSLLALAVAWKLG